MTSLQKFFGLGPPLNQKSWLYAYVRGEGAFRAVPLQFTACAPQARVNFCTSTRRQANFCLKTDNHSRFFSMKQQDRSREQDQEWTWSRSRFCDKDLFYFFWSSPPNLRAKSIPKEDNIVFGAKYSPDCCRIANASGLGCVSVPPKVFVPPETHFSGSGPVIILFYLQCTNYTVVLDQIANKSSSLFCFTKCYTDMLLIHCQKN